MMHTFKVWVWVTVLSAAAQAAQLEVRWSELSPLVVGRTVAIVLPDGTAVSGEAAAVRDAELAMDIRKTSNRTAHPKGMAAIPRASITTVEVREGRAVGGRVLGTVVGVVLGMVIGGEIVAHSNMSEGPSVGTFSAVTVASTVGGYYVGKKADQRSKTIRIVP